MTCKNYDTVQLARRVPDISEDFKSTITCELPFPITTKQYDPSSKMLSQDIELDLVEWAHHTHPGWMVINIGRNQ